MAKLYLLLAVLALNSCTPSIYERYFVPTKQAVTDQKEACMGYHAFVYNNTFGECVYEELRCLEGQRGSYCAYTQCANTRQKDTLRYLEFKNNPTYRYRKNIPCTALQKSDYPYIADGRTQLREWHSKRCQVQATRLIYIEEEPAFSELNFINSTIDVCGWGQQHYWSYGRQEGLYKDGKRVGKWSFAAFNDPFFEAANPSIQPLFVRQESNYKDGFKSGLTTYYTTQDSSRLVPSEWEDRFLTVPYKSGRIEGWVIEWNPDNRPVDSTHYSNDKPH